MPKKHTYEYVKNFIKSEGYTLLSDTYKNGQVKLSVKCNKGHEYEVKFNKFQQGQRCPFCYNELIFSKQERVIQG